MKRLNVPFALLLTTLLALPAMAADYYVSPAGNDVSGDGSVGNPWATITHSINAIDLAGTTDNTLHLAAGTYPFVEGGVPTGDEIEDYPIVLPAALGTIRIVGAGVGSTILNPIGHAIWDEQHIFTTGTGLQSLILSDFSVTNAHGIAYAQHMNSGSPDDSIAFINISGDNFNLTGTDFESPFVVNDVTKQVYARGLNLTGSRGETISGGGVLMLGEVHGDITVSQFKAYSTSTVWGRGGAICANNIYGKLTIEQFVCDETYSSNDGGAFYVGMVTDSVIIRNGTISDPYTEWGSGGAIAITHAQDVILIEQVLIDGARAFQDGGAIAIDNVEGDLTIDDCDITDNNTVWGEGGGISIERINADDITVTVSNTTVSGNSSDVSDGGGIQIDGGTSNNVDLVLDNLVVENNSSGEWGDGGGIAVEDVDNVTLTNSTIKDNYIDSAGNWYDGGGVYIENVEDLAVDNVAFVGNVAEGSGGGLAVENNNNVNDTQVLTNVVFVDNVAAGDIWSGDGGAYYTTEAGDVTIDYALFAGNYSTGDGGAIDFDTDSNGQDTGSLTVSSTTIAYNESGTDNGDAIFSESTTAGDSSFVVENSIVWANGDTSRTAEIDPNTDAIEGSTSNLVVSYSDVQTSDTVMDGEGNINVDPFFTDPGIDDFTVVSGSPVIDTGDPNSDIGDGVSDINVINIGYVPQSTTDPVTGETTTTPIGSVDAPVSTGTNAGTSEAQKGVLRDKYIMIGTPVLPLVNALDNIDQRDIFQAFGDDMDSTLPSQANQTWRFSRWENGTTIDPNYFGYVRYLETDSSGFEKGDPDSLKPGLGYWFVYNDGIWDHNPALTRDTTFIDLGAKMVTTDVPYVVELDPKPASMPYGYNMMANPWPFYITWQDVEFSLDQGNWFSPTDAAANDWIDAYAIAWDHVNQTYNPKTGRLDPWEGFWVIVKTDQPIWMRFNPNPVSSTLPTAASKFAQEVQQSLTWSTLITVRGLDTPYGDYNTWIGLGQNLSDAYDTYDSQDPAPQTYETIYARTAAVDAEGNPTSTRLSRDFRKDNITASGGFKAWRFMPMYTLSADNPQGKSISPVEVKIQWPTVGTLPDTVQLSLYAYSSSTFDPETAVLLVQDLAQTDSYTMDLDVAWGSELYYNSLWVVASIRGGSSNVAGVEDGDQGLPKRTQLASIYPNPFNPETNVRFDLARPGEVRIAVFNLLGQEVTTLVNGKWQAGYHQVNWNASGHSSGVYFVRMTMPETSFMQVKRIVVQK